MALVTNKILEAAELVEAIKDGERVAIIDDNDKVITVVRLVP